LRSFLSRKDFDKSLLLSQINLGEVSLPTFLSRKDFDKSLLLSQINLGEVSLPTFFSKKVGYFAVI